MPTTTLTQHSPEIELPPDAAPADDVGRRKSNPRPLVIWSTRNPANELDRLILHPEVKADILAGRRALDIRADLDRVWNLSAIQPQQGRCILNFDGPPGTGKTRAALGAARGLASRSTKWATPP
jgi:hypothetical protein